MIQEKIEAPDLLKSHDRRLVAWVVGLSTAYATVRYNGFKGVPWSDWPHFIGNKILALSALALIAIAVLRLTVARPLPIRRLMATGSAMALIHTLLSFGLFQPAYFDKFFVGAKLSVAGGVSLLAAAIAMGWLNWGKGQPGSSASANSAPLLAGIAFLSGVHAGLPSVSSWLQPRTWPGGLPPITLISFILGIVAAVAAARGRRLRSRSTNRDASAPLL